MTLNISILSDAHLEFHRDSGKEFVSSLETEGTEVLVLAGDIGAGAQLADALGRFCDHFQDAQIVYVHGNHTFYRSDRNTVCTLTKRLAREYHNLHWLDDGTVNIGGRRFVGTPLWFEERPDNILHESALTDFRLIDGYRSWVYAENRKAVRFIRETVQEGDIVVTHHLPSTKSVPERFRASSINRFFVCDMEDVIIGRQPLLWIHGHSHDASDYAIGRTRVVCNPFGYPTELNSGFRWPFLIKI